MLSALPSRQENCDDPQLRTDRRDEQFAHADKLHAGMQRKRRGTAARAERDARARLGSAALAAFSRSSKVARAVARLNDLRCEVMKRHQAMYDLVATEATVDALARAAGADVELEWDYGWDASTWEAMGVHTCVCAARCGALPVSPARTARAEASRRSGKPDGDAQAPLPAGTTT